MRTTGTNVAKLAGGGVVTRATGLNTRETVVRQVCRTRCNNGWMSRLETAVQPILRPMLKGIALRLSEAEQAVLATWAVKTAMMLACTDRDSTKVPRREDYGHLRIHQVPPPGTRVILSSYRGTKWAAYYFSQGLSIPPKGTTTLPKVPTAYFSTVCVGQVVFQVFGITAKGEFGLHNAASGRLAQIWPYERPLTWPPEHPLSDAELERFSQASVPFFVPRAG
jgi:hypothetical protein